MASTELIEKAKRAALVNGLIRPSTIMLGQPGMLAVDIIAAFDELVREGFLVGPVHVPREGNRGRSTTTVYVLKELYPTLSDIWQRHGVMYGGDA